MGFYQATCVYLARFLVRGGSDKSRGDSGDIVGWIILQTQAETPSSTRNDANVEYQEGRKL